MKFALATIFAASTVNAAYLKSPDVYADKFKEWQATHGVEIAEHEYDSRLEIFSQTDDEIEIHNAKNLTWTKGHNIYSHLTWEEFRDLKDLGRPMPPKPHLLGLARDNGNKHTEKGAPTYADKWWCLFDWLPGCGDDTGDNDDIEKVSDWVDKGGVTGVKDQGSCGSCWSFSTTGAIEGAYFLKTGSLVSFSEQQLVDCDIDGQDAGCNGGLMDNAFAWIKSNGGLCKEEDYPYKAVQNSCTPCTEVEGSAVSSWVDVESTDAAMMSALDQQTVSIAIEADQRDFQQYSGGVLTASCGSNLDHGVLAVGYGTMKFADHDDVDYYSV
jgi:C1A family cysteine protease